MYIFHSVSRNAITAILSLCRARTNGRKICKCIKKEIEKYALENKVMSKHNIEPEFIIKTIYIEEAHPHI